MKPYYLLIVSTFLLSMSSFAQQQTNKWYVKMEAGYGLGIKAHTYDRKGEAIEYLNTDTDYSNSKAFGIFPGKGSQIGFKIGKKFDSPIGLELGIRYQRSHRYDYSLTRHNTNKDGNITYSRKQMTKYYGYALTASPTIVFRKTTLFGVFYSSMGFSIGLGQWVSVVRSDYNNFQPSEFKYEKQKYMMGFHFGLGIEKPISNAFSLCADLRLNNLFYYYRNNRGLNHGYPKEYNKEIPFSNIALNLGLMYHF